MAGGVHGVHDLALLLLTETWAAEGSHGELLEERSRELLVLAAADSKRQGLDACERGVEDLLPVREEDSLGSVPRVLVQGGDHAFVEAVGGAVGERGLQDMSVNHFGV